MRSEDPWLCVSDFGQICLCRQYLSFMRRQENGVNSGLYLVPGVSSYEAIHPDHVWLNLFQEFLHRQPGGEIRLSIQGQYPEKIMMDTMSFRWHGSTVAIATKAVDATRVVFFVLGELRHRRRDVIEHPMYETVCAWRYERRVGIVAE